MSLPAQPKSAWEALGDALHRFVLIFSCEMSVPVSFLPWDRSGHPSEGHPGLPSICFLAEVGVWLPVSACSGQQRALRARLIKEKFSRAVRLGSKFRIKALLLIMESLKPS